MQTMFEIMRDGLVWNQFQTGDVGTSPNIAEHRRTSPNIAEHRRTSPDQPAPIHFNVLTEKKSASGLESEARD